MAFAIFAPAEAFIEDRLDYFLSDAASNVMSEVAGPLRLALVLYVLLYGIAILRGAISEPVMDFAVRSIKLALVYMLATTAAYGDWIAQPLFHGLPDSLAQAVSGNAAATPGAAFDQFFGRAAYLGQKIADTATLVDYAPWLMAGAVFLVGAATSALGFSIVMIGKVALALLVALGPIFVGCALFDASRRYFFGWLGQAVNYLVLFALILTVFQMILALVVAQWGDIEGQDPMVGGLLFIALCVLGALFFLQVPFLASGIAGGASVGLSDFAAAATGLRGHPPAPTAASTSGHSHAPRDGGSIRPVGVRT